MNCQSVRRARGCASTRLSTGAFVRADRLGAAGPSRRRGRRSRQDLSPGGRRATETGRRPRTGPGTRARLGGALTGAPPPLAPGPRRAASRPTRRPAPRSPTRRPAPRGRDSARGGDAPSLSSDVPSQVEGVGWKRSLSSRMFTVYYVTLFLLLGGGVGGGRSPHPHWIYPSHKFCKKFEMIKTTLKVVNFS
jgi:hypothetical protein